MRSLKKILLITMMFGSAVLLTQCHDEKPAADQQISYNRQNAQQHIIPNKEAAELTAGFREGVREFNRQLKDTSYLTKKFNMPLAELFNRDAIALLLNQKGAAGVRIYLGRDKKGLVRMVLVATDAQNNDIIGKNGKIMKFTSLDDPIDDGETIEAGQRCPTLCSLRSPLTQ